MAEHTRLFRHGRVVRREPWHLVEGSAGRPLHQPRLVLSRGALPHGRGHALVLMLSPGDAAPSAAARTSALPTTSPWRAGWSFQTTSAHSGPGAAFRCRAAVARPGQRDIEGDAITRYARRARWRDGGQAGVDWPKAAALVLRDWRRAVRRRPTHTWPASASVRACLLLLPR
jgi:hypothetical protein